MLHSTASAALGYLSTVPALMAIAFVAGVFLSQKVKDFVSGVPAEVRSALNNAEAATKANLATAQSGVLASLPKPPAPAKVIAPAAPAATVATPPAAG